MWEGLSLEIPICLMHILDQFHSEMVATQQHLKHLPVVSYSVNLSPVYIKNPLTWSEEKIWRKNNWPKIHRQKHKQHGMIWGYSGSTDAHRRLLRHMLVSHCLQAKRSAADVAGYHLGNMPISSVLRKHPVEHVQMTRRHSMTCVLCNSMQ
jgi:hypothetical protein